MQDGSQPIERTAERAEQERQVRSVRRECRHCGKDFNDVICSQPFDGTDRTHSCGAFVLDPDGQSGVTLEQAEKRAASEGAKLRVASGGITVEGTADQLAPEFDGARLRRCVISYRSPKFD